MLHAAEDLAPAADPFGVAERSDRDWFSQSPMLDFMFGRGDAALASACIHPYIRR
jgi:hypothetical protein